jgi:hypothetical protein
MKHCITLFTIIFCLSCGKNHSQKPVYYPLVVTDSVGLISLTSTPINALDSASIPYYSIASFIFSTGPLLLDSIPPNTILHRYNWTANDPFVIKYVGEQDLFSPDSLKYRQGDALIFSMNKALRGKELFDIYIDSLHLFNRVFAPAGRDVTILLYAVSSGNNLFTTAKIEQVFREFLTNKQLSKVHYAIN